MTQEIITSFTRFAFAVALGLIMASWSSAGHAYTEQQRIACTPDAFRLCSSEIPNVQGVTACMRKNRSSLSSACKAVLQQ